jgi:hypothetical protein
MSVERVAFDALISGLSRQLTGTSPEQVGKSAARALEQIGRFFNADLAWIVEMQAQRGSAQLMHSWSLDGVDHAWAGSDLAVALPWHYEAFIRHEPVILSSTADIPREGDADRQCLAARGESRTA